jgi:hypothetical protein
MTNPLGVLFVEPQNKPLSTAGLPQANCFRVFYVTGTTTLATIYQDGALTNPFSQSPTPITADSAGRFPPIYLDPAVIYRVQLYSAGSTIGVTTPLEDVDPYVPAPRNLFVKLKLTATSRVTSVVSADPDLQIPIPGAGTYAYEALLEVITSGSSGSNPGATIGIAFSGSLSALFATSNVVLGNMDGSVASSGAINANNNYSLNGANVLNFLQIRGTLTCSGPGTLSVQWAQQTTNAIATTMDAGSGLTAQQIG